MRISHLKKSVLIGLLLSLGISCNACNLIVNVPLIESEKDQLIYDLLVLSLSKTTTTVCLEQVTQVVTDARKTRMVEDNLLSLKWSSASNVLEKPLRPIKIPIFKGLLGYRILVIRKGEQHRFDKVSNLNDLRVMSAGQGSFWLETEILRTSGLPVVTSAQARHLWSMLARKRFDYMPLAIHEPWADLELRPELKLEVERNIMLVYPSALFFYVSPKNKTLYDLIATGMEAAIDDGSYDRKLYSSAMFKAVVQHGNLENRRVIDIPNALIDKSLFPADDKYWISIPSLVSPKRK